MTRKPIDAAVIMPDSSPVLTFVRFDRLDLFDRFSAPIQIVDRVLYEIIRPANDPKGKVAAWLARMGNRVSTVETLTGFGFRTKLERGEVPRGGNLGEIAVDEFATQIALPGSPTFISFVLFEDPDLLETRIAWLPRVDPLNAAAWVRALVDEGMTADGPQILDAINAQRVSPMKPVERPGKTRRVRST